MRTPAETNDPLTPDLSQFTADELEEFLVDYNQTLEDDYYLEMKRLLGAGHHTYASEGRAKLFAEAWVTARTGNLLRRQANAVSEARRAIRFENHLGEFDPAEFPSWKEMALECGVAAAAPETACAGTEESSFSDWSSMPAPCFPPPAARAPN